MNSAGIPTETGRILPWPFTTAASVLSGFNAQLLRSSRRRAAGCITGGVGIANDIEVRLPLIDERPDPDVVCESAEHAEVRAALFRRRDQRWFQNGWLTLECTADWELLGVFASDTGRQAHLSIRVAAALMTKRFELLSMPPSVEKIDVIAAKLPDERARP